MKKIISMSIVVLFCSLNMSIFACELNEVSTEANIIMYEMTQDDVYKLESEVDYNLSQEDERNVENYIEDEGFETQGEIAYEGDRARSWDVELGDYVGLTYYSQIDSRWRNHPYTATGNSSQTIGTSGCGPTAAAMVVTAIKGTILPDKMGDLFVQHGYRSANNGTYFSAFRAVADEFNMEYDETYSFDRALELVRNGSYVVASCGNGLFTTNGHFVVIVGIDGETFRIYDPFLYNGKFNTPTRRGKVSVSGNSVYCSVDNFRRYANYSKFFSYKKGEKTVDTNIIKYVNAKSGLNVRNAPNGTKVDALVNNTKVTVYETSGNWSRIGENRWVCSDYLGNSTTENTYSNNTYNSYTPSYRVGRYRVTASVLNVRTGPSTNYRIKSYKELTQNARNQNRKLGNYYTNGYRNGIYCDVSKVSGNFGLTPSGWICLDYCKKV